jgi:hypothetical protein
MNPVTLANKLVNTASTTEVRYVRNPWRNGKTLGRGQVNYSFHISFIISSPFLTSFHFYRAFGEVILSSASECSETPAAIKVMPLSEKLDEVLEGEAQEIANTLILQLESCSVQQYLI